MVDEQKLRELAGAATPGHWTMQHIGRNEWGAEVWTMNNEEIGHSEIAETYTSENAEFITAANPSATLALLDELQTLRSERTAWRVTAENAEKDAERYQHLVRLFGVTKLPCLLEPVVGDYVADGKESIDAAIDAMKETL